ncbi:MAG: LysM peptidoglycan-binding domain-containing protein [Bryobacteraceae bacterium]
MHVPKDSRDATVAALNRVPASHRDVWRLHRVETGDTLPLLARRYNAPVSSIASTNGLDDSLEEGSLLVIPVAPVPSRAVTRHRTPSRSVGTARRKTSAAHRVAANRRVSHKPTPAHARATTARRPPVQASHKAEQTYKTASLR